MNFSLTELQHLYRDMLRIRLTEEAIAARYGEQEMRLGDTRIFILPSPSGQARRFWNITPWQQLAKSIKSP